MVIASDLRDGQSVEIAVVSKERILASWHSKEEPTILAQPGCWNKRCIRSATKHRIERLCAAARPTNVVQSSPVLPARIFLSHLPAVGRYQNQLHSLMRRSGSDSEKLKTGDNNRFASPDMRCDAKALSRRRAAQSRWIVVKCPRASCILPRAVWDRNTSVTQRAVIGAVSEFSKRELPLSTTSSAVTIRSNPAICSRAA